MPKRTREDFLSLQRLSAMLDDVPPDATPWQVAARCATAMADALAAHAIVVHHHDASRRELRSIGVHGPNAGDLLGTTTNVDEDYVVTAVLTNKKPLMLRIDGTLPRFVPDRHRVLGSSRSLAAFPVLRGDACVGIVEIVGVAEERQQNIADACELVAERLVAAFESLPCRADATSETSPPAAGTASSQLARAARRRSFSDGEPRFVARAKREATADGVPATFPKRAPTLMCRSLHG